MALGRRGDEVVVDRQGPRHVARRRASHFDVEPTMSVRQKVRTPVGSDACHPARSRSTSSPADSGRFAGSVLSPRRMASSSCAACSGSMPSQVGRTPRRRLAGEEREGGGGQGVDVARPAGLAAGDELGGGVAAGPRPASQRGRRRRQPEVDEHDPPALGEHEVGRLHVAVNHRRVLAVEVGQRGCRIREPGEHDRRTEPGTAPGMEQATEVRALHPVHGDDVLVAVEEVVAHERHVGVWRDGRAAPRASASRASRSCSALTVRILRATKRSCW